jgi:hypothetical protein
MKRAFANLTNTDIGSSANMYGTIYCNTRASVTVSTIYYLIAYASFTTGPVTATGKIWARRAR